MTRSPFSLTIYCFPFSLCRPTSLKNSVPFGISTRCHRPLPPRRIRTSKQTLRSTSRIGYNANFILSGLPILAWSTDGEKENNQRARKKCQHHLGGQHFQAGERPKGREDLASDRSFSPDRASHAASDGASRERKKNAPAAGGKKINAHTRNRRAVPSGDRIPKCVAQPARFRRVAPELSGRRGAFLRSVFAAMRERQRSKSARKMQIQCSCVN